MSGSDLAKAVGVSPNSIYRLWKPKKMPRMEHDLLDALCKALKCQAGDLIVYLEDL
jgi:putative transcriptional regulator